MTEGARISPWYRHSAEWRNGYKRGYIVGAAGQRTRGIRYREGTFEMRCGDCVASSGVTAYWPLTEEFWNLRNLSACRACLLARKRRAAKERYWADPETHRNIARRYYAENEAIVLLKKRARYAEDPAAKVAAHREWEKANAEHIRTYRRMHYALNRERILLREKLRRAGVSQVKAA